MHVAPTDLEERLALLSFAARLLLSDDDREALLDRGFEALGDFARAREAALYLLEPGGDLVLERTSRGAAGARIAAADLDGTPLGAALTQKRPVSRPLDPDAAAPAPAREEPGSPDGCLCVPLLRAAGEPSGVAVLVPRDLASLDATAVQTLVVLQSILAVSLDNARAFRELRDAHEEMRSLLQAKNRMIEHLSHELRTPLAVLTASTRLLGKAAGRGDQKRAAAVRERMERALARLGELQAEATDISHGIATPDADLMTLWVERCADLMTSWTEESADTALAEQLRARIASLLGPTERERSEEIHLGDWLEGALEELAPRHRHRTVSLSCEREECPPVYLPEAALRKVVTGLVRNAFEATPDGGRIEISLREIDGHAELRVRDSGIGMDDELLRRLFFGFVHAGRTEDYSSGRPWEYGAGGSGLDLLRTKLFSERYGFAIEVVSAPGSGSTFTLRLPTAPEIREGDR